eukprot:12916612-Prorocentrum_lima.AAC.1
MVCKEPPSTHQCVEYTKHLSQARQEQDEVNLAQRWAVEQEALRTRTIFEAQDYMRKSEERVARE